MAGQTIPRTRKANPTAASRQQSIEQLVELVRRQAESTDADTLASMLARWNHATDPSPAETHPALHALTEGREYTPEEQAHLELQAQRHAFARRRQLLFGALTAAQVADLLGTRRQTPHDRVRSKTLLGVEENGRWLFPCWQFDANGPNGVVDGLPDALKALDLSSLGKVSWLTTPSPYLEGRTPLQALKDGEKERVLDQARAVGAL